MKKRLLSYLLVLCMALSLAPAARAVGKIENLRADDSSGVIT